MTKKDQSLLTKIAVGAEEFRGAKDVLRREAEARIKVELAAKEAALEQLVMDALNAGHSLTDVARAYTPPGSTPNRPRIYQIKRKHAAKQVPVIGEYPFRWEERVIETFAGERTVYDVVAILQDFGPDDVTGTYRWTYIGGELEPVIDPDIDPYPTTKAYRTVLQQWLLRNPYPGEDE